MLFVAMVTTPKYGLQGNGVASRLEVLVGSWRHRGSNIGGSCWGGVTVTLDWSCNMRWMPNDSDCDAVWRVGDMLHLCRMWSAINVLFLLNNVNKSLIELITAVRYVCHQSLCDHQPLPLGRQYLRYHLLFKLNKQMFAAEIVKNPKACIVG